MRQPQATKALTELKVYLSDPTAWRTDAATRCAAQIRAEGEAAVKRIWPMASKDLKSQLWARLGPTERSLVRALADQLPRFDQAHDEQAHCSENCDSNGL